MLVGRKMSLAHNEIISVSNLLNSLPSIIGILNRNDALKISIHPRFYSPFSQTPVQILSGGSLWPCKNGFGKCFWTNPRLKTEGKSTKVKQLTVCTKLRKLCLPGKGKGGEGMGREWDGGHGLTTASGFPHFHNPVISVFPVSSQSNTQQKRSWTFPPGQSVSTQARRVARPCVPSGQGHALWSQTSSIPFAALPSRFLVLVVSVCAASGSHKCGLPVEFLGFGVRQTWIVGFATLLTWENFCTSLCLSFLICEMVIVNVWHLVIMKRAAGRR